MKAKDLRLGNLFIEENSNKIIEVIGLEKDRIIYSGMFLDNWQAKPIPLTEEWLLKFGFDKRLEKESLQGGLFELIHNDIIGYRFAPEGAYGHPEIKYVHQLQNLYFALTTEELNGD